MSDPRFLNAAPFAVISNGDDTGVAIAAKTWNGSTPQEPITRVHIQAHTCIRKHACQFVGRRSTHTAVADDSDNT